MQDRNKRNKPLPSFSASLEIFWEAASVFVEAS